MVGNFLEDLRIEFSLGLPDALGERRGCVVGQHGYPRLGDDGPVVVLIVDEVHCATGFRSAGGEDCGVHVMPEHASTAEFREQGGMNVDDAGSVGGGDVPEAEETAHDDEVCGIAFEGGGDGV